MPDDGKKVPESYERNAPRFDDDEPEELPQFLMHMERMMELAKTKDDEKNAFLVRYAHRRPAEEWKKFESYEKSYKKFKKEIIENYPTSKDTERGSIRKLNKVMKTFDAEDIEISDADELMKLIRAMNVEVSKLKKSGLLTDREAVPMFLNKLDEAFQEKIIFALDQIRDRAPPPAAPADGTEPDDEEEEVGYTFEEVVREAKRLTKKYDNKLDYFNTNKRKDSGKGRSMSPAPSKTITVKSEPSGAEMRMLEDIKQSLVGMSNRMDSSDKRHASLEQLYKSLPGRIAGAPDSQTMPQRQQVRFRSVTQSDLCYYCQVAGEHFISDCPHRRRHLAEGRLKVVNGKDCFANGVQIPIQGNKSRNQLVEEYAKKPPGAAGVNYASAYVQESPGLYSLVGEGSGIGPDNSEYDYFDPNDYDPRDDEIRTLQVEQQKLMRQLVQHQSHSGGGVQPPPAAAKAVDNSVVSSLLAALNQSMAHTTELQLAIGTRANPSRTGTAPNPDF